MIRYFAKCFSSVCDLLLLRLQVSLINVVVQLLYISNLTHSDSVRTGQIISYNLFEKKCDANPNILSGKVIINGRNCFLEELKNNILATMALCIVPTLCRVKWTTHTLLWMANTAICMCLYIGMNTQITAVYSENKPAFKYLLFYF